MVTIYIGLVRSPARRSGFAIGNEFCIPLYNLNVGFAVILTNLRHRGRRNTRIIQPLQQLIAQNNLGDQVELGGTFCMGNCQKGVCVSVDDAFFSVTPETVEEFFQTNVKEKV